MPRWLIGDQLGNIKTLTFEKDSSGDAKIGLFHNDEKHKASIQCFAIGDARENRLLAAAYSDGRISTFNASQGLQTQPMCLNSWLEPRWNREGSHSFVGVEITNHGVLSCTSNGVLRLHKTFSETSEAQQPDPPSVASLPTRLTTWRMSQDRTVFAYGGDEVAPSLWDTTQALSQTEGQSAEPTSKKRKRDTLFTGEIWRAKSPSHDHLDLRRPTQVSALGFLESPQSGGHAIIAGTLSGALQKYDTRSGRKPVTLWTRVTPSTGIKVIENGLSEHELFVADTKSFLCSLDLRTGRCLYSYKGLAGAVTGIAPSSSGLLASGSLDRFIRLHSVVAPPPEPGTAQLEKPAILQRIYVASIPTVVIWDKTSLTPMNAGIPDDDDALWAAMKRVS